MDIRAGNACLTQINRMERYITAGALPFSHLPGQQDVVSKRAGFLANGFHSIGTGDPRSAALLLCTHLCFLCDGRPHHHAQWCRTVRPKQASTRGQQVQIPASKPETPLSTVRIVALQSPSYPPRRTMVASTTVRRQMAQTCWFLIDRGRRPGGSRSTHAIQRSAAKTEAL